MLVYKLLGGGVLVCCGFLYPCFCARDRRAALLQINALISLVRFLRRHIECYRLSVKEILLRCDDVLLREFGSRQEGLLALFESTSWLDRQAEAVALELARALGRGSLSEQLQICDRALEELVAYRSQKAESERSRCKTERVLSLGAAALAVILFL